MMDAVNVAAKILIADWFNIDWNVEVCVPRARALKFIRSLHEYVMRRYVKESDGFRARSIPSLVDPVIINLERGLKQAKLYLPLETGDHVIVKWNLRVVLLKL